MRIAWLLVLTICTVLAVGDQLSSVFLFSAPLDFGGHGRSDFAILRAPSEGAPFTWWIADAFLPTVTVATWGVRNHDQDRVVPADYDGDGRTDFAVWRPGPVGVAGFWIVPSSTGIGYFVPLGMSGDDPTVVADYDGDGRADPAVYRDTGVPGTACTWWYKSSLTGEIVGTVWGMDYDQPAPGDYDGDGRADFVVRRPAPGYGLFLLRMATGATSSVIWGNEWDAIVPGDYDGDGKTDLAVVQYTPNGPDLWSIKRSSDGQMMTANWGEVTTDYLAPGDYDGDGKTDPAVWRAVAAPGLQAFYVLLSSGGTMVRYWGQAGDYPIAASRVH
jgi:hypothetical protein